MHSVRIELVKLILVGTRITYQATGDAGHVYVHCDIISRVRTLLLSFFCFSGVFFHFAVVIGYWCLSCDTDWILGV